MTAAAVAAPPELLAAAEHIVKVLVDGGGAAWSTMTGVDLAFHPGPARYDVPAALAAGFGPAVETRIAWTGDRAGTLYLLLGADGAKAIIAHMMALMMGGPADPAGTQLDAEGMDAYAEAANNFAGQGAQALRGDLGGALKFAAERTTLVDDPAAKAAELFGAEPLAGQTGTFTLGSAGPYPLAVWMTAPCTGVEVQAADGEEEADPATEALLREFAAENIAHVLKLPVPLVVVLAEKKMRMELIQEMAPGTIIEFRKQSGEILDVCANNVKIAEAEVVTTNQHFGVQLRRMVDPREAKAAAE